MLVKKLRAIEKSDADVTADERRSRRLLLEGDGTGFSLHDTVIRAGTVTRMGYRNHLEAVCCIEGRGTLESIDDGRLWSIEPGTLYALDRHAKHILRADTAMRMVCVVSPPVVGAGLHRHGGSYPAAAE